MIRFFLVIFLVFFTSTAQTFRYALVVGQNDGGSGVNKLQYAERDANRIADVLRNIGDFSSENVVVLLSPDSLKLDEQINKIKRKIKERGEQDHALFLLYFSGHADANSLLLSSTRYSLEKLQNVITQFPAAFRIAIFDACQSGAVTTFKGGKRAEPFYLQNNGPTVKGQVIIASASAQERAQESPTLKGSVFTFHWINGLNGSADVSSDNQVTLNEAYQYAYRKTIETSALTTGEIQHPVYRFNITGQGDIILANLNKSEAGLFLDKTCEGKFLVLSQDYMDVYADFFKERDRDVFISLNHGTYTIVNARGKDVGTFAFTLKKKNIFHFAQSMLIPNTLTESRIKGNNDNTIETAAEKSNYSILLHRYIPGIGFGFSLYPKTVTSDRDIDLNIHLTNNIYLKSNLSLFADAYCMTLNRIGGMGAGIDFYHSHSFTDLFAGAGIGGEYVFEKYGRVKDGLSPTIMVHSGFSTALGRNTKIQIRIPVTAILHHKTEFRSGIDMTMLLTVF